MALYHCILKHKGYLQESFYRNAESVEAIEEYLKLWQWGKGVWTIKLHRYDDED